MVLGSSWNSAQGQGHHPIAAGKAKIRSYASGSAPTNSIAGKMLRRRLHGMITGEPAKISRRCGFVSRGELAGEEMVVGDGDGRGGAGAGEGLGRRGFSSM
uniref:Uncharacterized protein n=1 Tax=Oryza meridionalis TaxID=40149 RepID=A0A0E0EBI2_9ORYZ